MRFIGCGKVYHFSYESADIQAKELERISGVRPDVYLHERCGCYHVGYTTDQAGLLKPAAQRRRQEYHQKRMNFVAAQLSQGASV